ncbi:MAG: hypothetical protein WKG52_06265 [Variovorax sp.]
MVFPGSTEFKGRDLIGCPAFDEYRIALKGYRRPRLYKAAMCAVRFAVMVAR